MSNNTGIKKVGLIGTGVIGAGWATRLLSNGIDVVAYDLAPGAEERLREFVKRATPFSQQLSLYQGNAKLGELTFADSIEEMAKDADLIQESAPENEAIKKKILADISQYAKPDAIIASSSSGLLPSVLQTACQNPERMLIGHPFNPVYLLPLCEVVGGELTSAENIQRASDFYKSIGMKVLHVRKEIEGYISDRLQEALWREILHMVNEGIATTEELDDAIIYGPGLRWAMMGTCLTFHLAGGKQGMRHMLEQFGPALKLPWTKLIAPELNDTLIDRMVEGTKAQAGDRSIADLEDQRDECLIAIMRTLREKDVGAGKVLAEQEALLYQKSEWRSYDPKNAIPAPLDIYRSQVSSQWIDYNGHMTDGAYLIAFGDAFDAFARFIGCDESYRENDKMSFFTAEAHVNYYKEAKAGEPLLFTTQIIYADAKKVHLHHAMYKADEDKTLLATSEQMLLHVDLSQSKVTPMSGHRLEALMAVAKAHQILPKPEDCGRVIGVK